MPDFFAGLPKAEITGFRGPNTRSDARDPWGEGSFNCEYDTLEVRTRRGFYEWQAAAMAGVVRTMPIFGPDGVFNCIIASPYFASPMGMNVGVPSAAIPTTSPVTFASTEVPNFATWFNRIYVNAVTKGQGQKGNTLSWPKYWMYKTGLSAFYDAFRPPFISTEIGITAVDSGAGNMTAGTHSVLVVFETESGFRSRFSPWINNTTGFTAWKYAEFPITITANRKITVTVNTIANWPADLKYAYLVVTTAANGARFFQAPVPAQSVPVGTTTNIVFELSDSDAIIAQQADWTGYGQRLCKNPGTGHWPFALRVAVAVGSRMAWVVSGDDAASSTVTGTVIERGPGVFFSDTNQPEVITEEFHFKKLASGKDCITVMSIDQVIYGIGPDWTHVTTDTGGYPVTWPTFKEISTVGTSHHNGTLQNPLGYGLVAHESGLYVLRAGGYDPLPLSYLTQPEWSKIKWPTASVTPTFQIAEDAEDRKIYVQCLTSDYPDGCLYVYDYAEGMSHDKVKFSIWTLPNGVGSVCMVHNFGDSNDPNVRQQLALFPTTSGKVALRKSKGQVGEFNDLGTLNIPTSYSTSHLGQIDGLPVLQSVGTTIVAEGSGDLRITAYPIGNATSVALRNTTLASSPPRRFERLFNLRSEGFSLKYQNSTEPGAWFRLVSRLSGPMQLFYKIWSRRRKN